MSSEYPEDLRGLVEGYLEELQFSEVDATTGLDEAMRYSLLAGGKRIRPVLTLATARATGADPETLLPAAAAIELIHTYSLIHDDLPAMDDDDLRRGRPTSHVVYGENVAILAGDGLFPRHCACSASARGNPRTGCRSAARVDESHRGDRMVGGQYIDVTEGGGDADGLRELHEMKTGRLIGASVGVALELTAPEPDAAAPYRRFAAELGVLFQIVDDILDVTGETADLGKPSGSDERHGKVTYVSLFGLERARELAAESTRTHAVRWQRQTGTPRTYS